MPWKEKDLRAMREEFVKRVLSHEKTKTELCKEYNISRPTGDKWIERFSHGEAMSDRSRAPITPAHKTDPDLEALIVACRMKYPALGAVKIHRILSNEGVSGLPSSRTVNEIFRRNGLISREASLAVKPITRFEKEQPNEMWQADFKGHFLMNDGKRCFPLNIIDDASRFNLCCEALTGETFSLVKPVVTRLFEDFGLPFSLLCDNGNPWGTQQSTGFTAFEVWLMELGVLVLHGRPQHPQTQGKEERFNQSLKREWLKFNSFDDIADASVKLNEYREFYNNKRPHHAIGLDTPATRYERSAREYPGAIREWEYPEGCTLCRVKSSGYITIKGQGYYLSEGFRGKQIAYRMSRREPGRINLYFRQFSIGQIDIERRVFTYKRAYLTDGDPRHNK